MGEEAKHSRNDEACALRGWTCIPLVVEVFGGWGNEAINVLSKKVATQLCRPLNEVISTMYGPLSLTLMRQNVRAILARCVSPHLVTLSCCSALMCILLFYCGSLFDYNSYSNQLGNYNVHCI